MPCFVGGTETEVSLKRHLMLHLKTSSVAEAVNGLVDEALDHWTTRQYDNFQRLTNNISS